MTKNLRDGNTVKRSEKGTVGETIYFDSSEINETNRENCIISGLNFFFSGFRQSVNLSCYDRPDTKIVTGEKGYNIQRVKISESQGNYIYSGRATTHRMEEGYTTVQHPTTFILH